MPTEPGSVANLVFECEFKTAAVIGLCVLGLNHSTGIVSLAGAVPLVFVLSLFPVYLVFVAIVLSA